MTSTRFSIVALALALFAGVSVAYAQSVALDVDISRGNTNGSGTAKLTVTSPAASFGRVVVYSIDDKVVSRSQPVAKDAAINNAFRAERIFDGKHMASVHFEYAVSGEVVAGSERNSPFEITDNTGTGLEYQATIVSKDYNKRSVTVELKFPSHALSRNVFAQVVGKSESGSAGQLNITGGTLRFVVNGFDPGMNQLKVTVREREASRELWGQTLEVDVGKFQDEDCKVTQVRPNIAQKSAYVEIALDLPSALALTYYDVIYSIEGTEQGRTIADGSTEVSNFTFKNLPEERVYTGYVTVKESVGMKRQLCESAFKIDLCPAGDTACAEKAKNGDGTPVGGEGNNDPVVPPTEERTTPATERARFTWLSGKCISEAEQVKLSAVGCVIGDTIGLLLELVGVVSTGIVVYGGFRLVIATDDAARGNAKKVITYALIGLVVVLLSFVLVQIFFGGGIL